MENLQWVNRIVEKAKRILRNKKWRHLLIIRREDFEEEEEDFEVEDLEEEDFEEEDFEKEE